MIRSGSEYASGIRTGGAELTSQRALTLQRELPTQNTDIALPISATTTNQQSYTAAGGLTTGGTAAVVHRQVIAATSGLTSGGTGVVTHRQTVVAAGGLTAAGTATPLHHQTISAAGGLVSSGAATVTHAQVWTGAGGLTTGGAASASSSATVHLSYTAAGGLTTGGVSPATVNRPFASSGGLTTGGATVALKRQLAVASGGLTAGGAAGSVHRQTYTAAAGLVSGGAAVTLHRQVWTAAGGLVTSGTSPAAVVRPATAAGGLVLAGAGTASRRSTWNSTGGLVLGGSAAARSTAPIHVAYTASGGATAAGVGGLTVRLHATSTGGVALAGAATASMIDITQQPVPPTPQPWMPAAAAGGGFYSARREMLTRAQAQRAARETRTEPTSDALPVQYVHVASGGFVIAGAAIVEQRHAPAWALHRDRSILHTDTDTHALTIPVVSDRLHDAPTIVASDPTTAYYDDVAHLLLPHVQGRPLMIKHWPDGRDHAPVWQRDAPSDTPSWIRVVDAPRRGDGPDHHAMVIDDLDSLQWITRRGDVELHPYGYRASDPNAPIAVWFDLDPGAGVTLTDVVTVARHLRSLLAAWELHSFVKYSGSKGLHVAVPIQGQTFSDVARFARPIVKQLAQAEPDTITVKIPRAERVGKTWIDWTANGRRRTIAAPWTWRNTTGVQVSLPIAWDELDDLPMNDPMGAITYATRHGDRWADLGTVHQHVPDLVTIAADDAALFGILA